SLRIPPGQDPATAMTALTEHLQRHAPATARVTVHQGEQGKPYQARQDAPAMALARQALQTARGAEAVDTGLGGSIPFLAHLVDGVEAPESRSHGIDESRHVGEFARVCLAEALLLRGAGELGIDQGVSSEGTA